MSLVRGVQNVYVAATDLETAVSFYRDVLGLTLKFRDGARWAQFEAATGPFAVAAAGEGAASPGGGAVVVFEVTSLEGAIDLLRSRGLAIESGPVDMGAHGRYVTVRDPSGNPVQLFQRSGRDATSS